MAKQPLPDYVERRIVLEYGLQYAYLYITDGAGKLLDEESFRQPYRMDRKECHEESRDAHAIIYDWLNDTINYPTAGLGGERDTPEE
jgi:hypothetical protein